MIGYGPGTALDQAQPLPRVQTKTTLTAMLGGKMMKGRGGQDAPRIRYLAPSPVSVNSGSLLQVQAATVFVPDNFPRADLLSYKLND